MKMLWLLCCKRMLSTNKVSWQKQDCKLLVTCSHLIKFTAMLEPKWQHYKNRFKLRKMSHYLHFLVFPYSTWTLWCKNYVRGEAAPFLLQEQHIKGGMKKKREKRTTLHPETQEHEVVVKIIAILGWKLSICFCFFISSGLQRKLKVFHCRWPPAYWGPQEDKWNNY